MHRKDRKEKHRKRHIEGNYSVCWERGRKRESERVVRRNLEALLWKGATKIGREDCCYVIAYPSAALNWTKSSDGQGAIVYVVVSPSHIGMKACKLLPVCFGIQRAAE